MATIKEQIEMIRAEIDKTQKNKATNAHIGKLKAKIIVNKILQFCESYVLERRYFHDWPVARES